MILAIEILSIFTMCTIIFILIWGFITLTQILNQLKYKNYLMEKLTQYIYTLSRKDDVLLDHNSENNSKDKKTQ